MDRKELQQRTKKFALRIIKLVEALPKTVTGRAIGYQLVKAGTSVGANYRAACRGRSKAEFNSKLHIVLEEAEEKVNGELTRKLGVIFLRGDTIIMVSPA